MHGPHCTGKLGNCQRKIPVMKNLIEKESGDHAKTKGKTLGNLYAQIANSLIVKITDIAMHVHVFATKSIQKVSVSAKSVPHMK